MKQWEQVKVDITFIMGTRSAKWWRGKELCQHLRQLGHADCTPKSIKYILGELVDLGYLEKTRVKPQWTLYAYRLKREYVSDKHIGYMIEKRDASNILW